MIFYFLLASWGITSIITMGGIFKKVRYKVAKFSSILGELISCSHCLGFWVGMGLSFVLHVNLQCHYLVESFLQATMSSGICLLLSAFLLHCGWQPEVYNEDEKVDSDSN